MRKISLVISILSLFIIQACQSPKDKSFGEIKKLEKQLMSSMERTNDSVAMVLIEKYTDYAHQYKDDPLTPEFMFKSAELCNAMGMPGKSINTYYAINLEYPGYTRAPESLFLCGFIAETSEADTLKAKKFYQEFIQKYPNHKLAKDAESSLRYLHMSPEEMIREFEAKNKKEEGQ